MSAQTHGNFRHIKTIHTEYYTIHIYIYRHKMYLEYHVLFHTHTNTNTCTYKSINELTSVYNCQFFKCTPNPPAPCSVHTVYNTAESWAIWFFWNFLTRSFSLPCWRVEMKKYRTPTFSSPIQYIYTYKYHCISYLIPYTISHNIRWKMGKM